MYYITLALAHLAADIVVWMSSLSVSEQFIVTALLLFGFAFSAALWKTVDQFSSSSAKSLLGMIQVYYLVGLIMKIPVVLIYPDQIEIPGDVQLHKFLDEYLLGHLVFLVGYVGFSMGLLSLCMTGRFGDAFAAQRVVAVSPKGIGLLFLVSLMLLVLKVFAQLRLGIATPGVTPEVLPIPYLTGVIWLLALVSTFVAINCTLFFCLAAERYLLSIWAVLIVLVNIASDLSVGTKSSLMYELFVLVWYYFAVRKQGPVRPVEFVYLLGLALFGAVAISVYKYINFYRYALLSGMSIQDALTSAMSLQETHGSGSLISILNRINGLDTIIISLSLIGDYPLSFSEYFSDGAVNAVRYAVYGAGFDEILGAFGTTQFVPAYLLMGFFGVFVLFYLLACAQLVVAFYLKWQRSLATGVYAGVLPILMTEYVKIIFSSGGFDLIIKTLFVFAVTAYVLGKLVVSASPGSKAKVRLFVY